MGNRNQLQLDLDDRQQVRYVYPNTDLTGKLGRVVAVYDYIAEVYFDGHGVILCGLENLQPTDRLFIYPTR